MVKSLGTRINTGKVKERVGVDTLFWRRYFVTYGALLGHLFSSFVYCRSPYIYWGYGIFVLSSFCVFLHLFLHQFVANFVAAFFCYFFQIVKTSFFLYLIYAPSAGFEPAHQNSLITHGLANRRLTN